MKLTLSIIISFVCNIFDITFAQTSIRASATATVMHAVSIQKVQYSDPIFNKTLVGSSGNIILKALRIPADTLNIILPQVIAKFKVAEFIVSGKDSYSFSITFPVTSIPVLNNMENNSMIVDCFEFSETIIGGSQIVKIGADLIVNDQPSPGVYQAELPLTIIFNYN